MAVAGIAIGIAGGRDGASTTSTTTRPESVAKSDAKSVATEAASPAAKPLTTPAEPPPRQTLPKTFKVTKRSVTKLIEGQLGEARLEERVRSLHCSGGICSVAYTADHKGRGAAAGEVLAFVLPMFRDRRIDRIIVSIVHKRTAPGAKPQEVAFLKVDCRPLPGRRAADCQEGEKVTGKDKYGKGRKQTAQPTGRPRDSRGD
jgi:hypothetical protein